MLTAFERKIAFRYLRARREEGLISVIAFFSLIGIALGVATLIVVLAVMNGVRGEMIKSIIGLEGHISIYANAGGIENYDLLSHDLAATPEVLSAIPKVEGQAMASYHGAAVGAVVTGYRPEDLQKKPLLTQKITQGDLSAFERGEGIIIGSRMAEKLGLHIGDELTLISPEGQATVAGFVPRVKAYPVVAIFSVGMFSYDNSYIVLPFSDAQIYFKLKNQYLDSVSSLELNLRNADHAPSMARALADKLGIDYRVYDWKRSNAGIFQAVMVQRNVMFLILMLIIIVATFNIISSLIMLVREKGKDVAILRTMGASKSSIMKIFVTCGASVGVVGTVIGVALGLLISFNTENIQAWLERMTGHKLFADELYFLSKLPAKVEPNEVLMVVAMSLALSLLATIYPARRAANVDPAEGLRYE